MLLKAFVLHLVLAFVTCYYLLPERSENVYVNHKYVVWAAFTVHRFGRSSPHYIKLAGEILHQWNNNVTVNVLIQEKLSNMYKPTFIDFHFPLCDMIETDHIIGTMIREAGVICPLEKGKQSMENMTVTMGDFPNVFPFTHGRAEVLIWITKTQEVLYHAFLYWTMLKENPNLKVRKPTKNKAALVVYKSGSRK